MVHLITPHIRGLLNANRILLLNRGLYVQLLAASPKFNGSCKFYSTKYDGRLSKYPYSTQSFEIPSQMVQEEEKAIVKEDQGRRDNDERLERVILASLKALTGAYDLLTLPIYASLQKPWKKVALSNSPKAVLLDSEKMIYGSVFQKFPVHEELDSNGIDTFEKLFSYAAMKNGSKMSLGSREVLSEEEVADPQNPGKFIKKFELGEYRWKTYAEVDALATLLSSRLSQIIGLKPRDKVAIFAETREEWLICAMAAFKQNITIVTLFTALADDGAVHALKETGVSCLITSEELMGRCEDILKSVPNVRDIVCIDGRSPQAKYNPEKLSKSIKVHRYSNLISSEPETVTPSIPEDVRPSKHDPAIIMYTSGSTGIPKGVILSHFNMVSGLIASLDIFQLQMVTIPNDCYIAYLPLGHVMELMSEAICLVQGVPIGYSSPLTLTDKSLGVKEGSKGDASILKPSLILAVPLVIERICKGIQAKIAESSKLAQIIFKFFYNYKVNWVQRGWDTPLVNRLLFSKIRELVGGRLRFVVTGGAPLAPQTHEFFRTALCVPVCLGYGMTESCAIGTLQAGFDLTVGRCGGPISSNVFRVVDWDEGNYKVTDKPYPRGEILIGGDNVAMGYYNIPSEDFFEEDGKRWIRTGDICQVEEDGAFRIIDRKKDLVKLASGEYLSLGKIEAALKSTPIVENICVISDPSKPYPVAIMCPNAPYVEKFAEFKLGKSPGNFKDLCDDPAVEEALLSELQERARDLNLERWEIPRRIFLVSEPWLPQSGLVTASFKIKRANIMKTYQNEIKDMLDRVPDPQACRP